MKRLLVAAIFFAFAAASIGEVVRPAPDFSWQGVGGRLSKVRGQPVVLVFAKSPRSHAFRTQAKRLREFYQQFAAKHVVFVAAFQENAKDTARVGGS